MAGLGRLKDGVASARLCPATHVLNVGAPKTWMPGTRLHKAGHGEWIELSRYLKGKPYALAMSGKTASILVFSVAALNGLTI
jgi:hypothetical protein